MIRRAIAWDVDGTLVDSETRHHRALVTAAARFGVDLAALPDQAFRGLHNHAVWTRLRRRFPARFAAETLLDAIDDAYIADGAAPLAPMPFAVETIAALGARGIAQACVSNSNRRIVRANLAAIGVAPWIGAIVGLDDVPRGKPDPAPYLRGCALLGLPPEAVLAVEDSTTGVRAARAAGMGVIGYAAPGAAAPEGADRVIDDLRAVSALIASG